MLGQSCKVQSLNIHPANVNKMLSCMLMTVLLKFCPLNYWSMEKATTVKMLFCNILPSLYYLSQVSVNVVTWRVTKCVIQKLSLSLMERVFSHLRVATSAPKGKMGKMAGIYKLEQWTVGQRGFRKVIQGFNFLMKDLWGMFCMKLKSMPYLALGSHFIVSS